MSQPTIDQLLDPKHQPFYYFHSFQLIDIQFPINKDLIEKLHDKLENGIFDAGHYFQVLANHDIDSFQAVALKDMKANEDVFLIDHAFTFKQRELRKALEPNQALRDRLKNILTFADKKPEHPNHKSEQDDKQYLLIPEYDDQEIEDPTTIEIPQDAVGVSFWGNKIADFEKLKQALQKLKNLKVIWLNDNPVAEDFEALRKWIEENFPQIELLNSEFTANCSLWGIKFGHFYPNFKEFEETDITKVRYLNLDRRNVFRLPDYEVFNKFTNVDTLNLKSHEFTDVTHTNKFFALIKAFPNLRNIECDEQITGILWDIYKNKKLQQITETLKYVNGYALSFGRTLKQEDDVRYIMKNIWQKTGTYRLASENQLDQENIWYVMDEFGSAVRHNDDANSRIAPFLYAPNNKLDKAIISYSLLWLVKDVKAGEEITRDHLFGIPETGGRLARSSILYDIPMDKFDNQFRQMQEILKQKNEEVKQMDLKHPERKFEDKDRLPFKVASDYELCIKNLTDENFKIIKGLEEADIAWLYTNIADFKEFEGKFTNQFPYEACIVNKLYLADTVNKGAGNVEWMQPTYDLATELEAFIGHYNYRKKNHLSNLWIIKSPALARSMDMVVTDNLDMIIRMIETGPRIAQKYIENPSLVKKRKYDMRFLIAVRSIAPLEVFIYNNFYGRIADREYTLDPRSFESFETHWTVMKYGSDEAIEYPDEKIKAFFDKENENKGLGFDNNVLPKVKKILRELFAAVLRTHPEMKRDESRAVYGMDVMVDDQCQVQLLEMTYCPDCGTITKFNPSFFNDLFNCLFLHKNNNFVSIFDE